MKQQTRPVYLNLPNLALKMSVTAKMSILHRASGVLMFLAIPFVLYLLHQSLTNPDLYANTYSCLTSKPVKVVYIVLLWALMHHMLAGIRFLLLDIHVGIERKVAQSTAGIVVIAGIILTVVLGVLIW